MSEGIAPRPHLATRAARKSAPAGGGTRIPRGSPGAVPTPYLAVVGAERSLPAIWDEALLPTNESEADRGPHAYPNYTWDVQGRLVTPEDLERQAVKFHDKIRTELETDEGDFQAITFKRGLHIYVLPDPHTLPEPAGGKVIQPCSLPLRSHWTAEIVDCCAVTTPRTDGSAFGFLKVRWLYSPSEALDSPYIPQDVKEQIQGWEFERDEKIRTDHYDFISLETYGYSAPPFRTRIEITGMAVTNDQVVTERSKRTVVPDGTAYPGVTVRLPSSRPERQESVDLKSDDSQ